MDAASSSVHPSAHSLSLPVHEDTMGTAISAVRNGRNVLKRRVDIRHDDPDESSRHPKRMRGGTRVEPDERDSSPPASADTTLVNDADEETTGLKGKAKGDTPPSPVVSTLLPVRELPDQPSPPDSRGPQLADEIESELRVVQSLVSALLRVYPERTRTERERAQADEIYTAGREIPVPPPRAPNPDMLLPQQQNSANDNLARPCPHCAPHNSFDWTCPRPIPNPDTDRDSAWSLDNGPPPGHNYCGACDELHAIGAPTSTRCDMCTTGFCGISVPQVCRSHWLHQVRLLSDYNSLQGMIENGRVYDMFNGNPIEVEILFDYLREAEITPNMIYLDIIDHILATPEGFEPLIANDVFRSSHPLDMRIPDAQYAAARPGLDRDSSVPSLPSALFAADFTDEEDSDGESERRTTTSTGSRVTINEVERSRTTENGTSPTTVLPRLADLMRSMRDTEVAPSLTLPAVARRSAPLASPVPAPAPALAASSAPVPPPAPRRRRICRECATEVFVYGLKDWWAREMNTKLGKERLPVWVVSRKQCPSGESCTEQLNYDHAKAPRNGPSFGANNATLITILSSHRETSLSQYLKRHPPKSIHTPVATDMPSIAGYFASYPDCLEWIHTQCPQRLQDKPRPGAGSVEIEIWERLSKKGQSKLFEFHLLPEPGKPSERTNGLQYGLMFGRRESLAEEYLPPRTEVEVHGRRRIENSFGLKVSDWTVIYYSDDDPEFETMVLKPAELQEDPSPNPELRCPNCHTGLSITH